MAWGRRAGKICFLYLFWVALQVQSTQVLGILIIPLLFYFCFLVVLF